MSYNDEVPSSVPLSLGQNMELPMWPLHLTDLAFACFSSFPWASSSPLLSSPLFFSPPLSSPPFPSSLLSSLLFSHYAVGFRLFSPSGKTLSSLLWLPLGQSFRFKLLFEKKYGWPH
jgi:hypothetical protein